MKENKTNARIPIWIFTALAIGVLLGYVVRNITSGKPAFQPTAKISELDEVLYYVKERYVDSVDIDELEDDAIVNALKELDPHSMFLPAEMLARENEQIEGEYEGIGVEFMIVEDTIQVVTAMSGGPSKEIGIQAGDQIITVNDSTVAGVGITNTGVIDLLKGPKGTSVNVGIKRGKRKKLIDFEITRAPININSIDVAYMISDTTGYIKINRFSTKTAREFRVQLDKLVKSGMQNLIIDLRGNGGGVMRDALEVLDQVIGEQKNLLTVKGRKYQQEKYNATSQGLFEDGRLAILIDEGSASASEIVAGAIQDWDRGVIIGRRSFGKGLVQRSYSLKDGDGLRLTVARYFTPSGRSIQRSYENGVEDYFTDYYERSVSGEMLSRDSIKVDSSLVKYTLQNRRKVFGGGGIIPDIFIPVDTTQTNDFTTKAFSQRIPSEFTYDYYNSNKSAFNSYENATQFEKRFFVSSSLYDRFVAYVKSRFPEEEFSPDDIVDSKEDITLYMKALIARQLFGDEGFFIVMNDDDDAILRALSVLNDNKYETVLQPAEK